MSATKSVGRTERFDSVVNSGLFHVFSDEDPRYFLGGEKQMDEGLNLLEGQLKGKKAVFSP